MFNGYAEEKVRKFYRYFRVKMHLKYFWICFSRMRRYFKIVHHGYKVKIDCGFEKS